MNKEKRINECDCKNVGFINNDWLCLECGEKIDHDENKEKNPAHDWKTYIEQAIKTGLESPTPYKVIPYKNGIGIKKIEFFKPIKNNSL